MGVVDQARNRRSLWGLLASTALSVSGNATIAVLVPWLVLRETDNAAYAGFVNSAALVAALASLMFGAAVVDRWNRRNLSGGADLLSAAAVAAIPIAELLGQLNIASITVLVVVGALFDGPGRSAREALRPRIAQVSGTTLERTNALGEVCDGIGNVAGPAGAGVAVAAIGLFGSFWLASGVLAVAGVVFLASQETPPARKDTSEQVSYVREAIRGVQLVRRDSVLRATATAATLFGLFLAPIVFVLTAHFERAGRATALGGLLAAFSFGAIVGALGYALIGHRVARRSLLLVGVSGVAGGLLAMSQLLDHVGALVVVATLTGALAGPMGPVFSVVIQERTSDEFRGRVLTTIGTFELVAAPLALAVAGVLVERTSPSTALVISGVGALGAGFYTATAPGLRRIERRQLIEEQRTS